MKTDSTQAKKKIEEEMFVSLGFSDDSVFFQDVTAMAGTSNTCGYQCTQSGGCQGGGPKTSGCTQTDPTCNSTCNC